MLEQSKRQEVRSRHHAQMNCNLLTGLFSQKRFLSQQTNLNPNMITINNASHYIKQVRVALDYTTNLSL
jgi:hypothetical protein